MSASTLASSPRSFAAESNHRSLKVGGITPFTATDYPGKLSAVVFVQGCPWQCGYCHNPHLQLRLQKSPLQWSRVFGLLQKRVGLIDAVVFSGGEPTLDPALPDAIADVRKLGFSVGLHSGGVYPKHLKAVLPMVDWVGLDIKAPFDCYERVTGVADSGQSARISAEAVLESGVKHEFRTTVHQSLLSEDDVVDLAQTLAGMGVQNYALQSFRSQGCKNKNLKSLAGAGNLSDDLIRKVSGHFANFSVRSD
ncbi:anaerobic ribonucleoside-triphosphate reductase activating protein [Noviherbaspirillum agri]